MRICEAFIFAVYAALVEWLLFGFLPSYTGGLLTLTIITFIGVFLISLLYLKKHSLDHPLQGVVLGAISVFGVFLVIVVLMQTTIYVGHNLRVSTGSAWQLAASLGLLSLVFGPLALPVPLLCGAVAGAIYVLMKRRLLSNAQTAVAAEPRRSAIFWVAIVLGFTMLTPVVIAKAILVIHAIVR
jgi:hypothetical protein